MPLGGENIGRAYVMIVADGSDLDESIRREFEGADPDVREAGRRHAKEYRKGFDDDRHPILAKFDQEVKQLGDTIGRAFGKGSRNDFLNFTGRVVEGLVNIGRIFPRAIGFFEDWAASIREAEGVGRTLLATFSPVLKVIGGVGLAFAGLHLLIGPLVSAISLLGGVLTALASSLSFAAVGGVAALAGALVPLAAGAGVAALALVGLTKAQKALLKTDLRPTISAFHDLQDAARRPLFANLSQQASRFGVILRGWRPLFREVGQSISKIGDYWLNALNGPGYTRFKNAISKFLPGAVLSLGKSFGNLAGGLGGAFRAMIPLTQDFLAWLQRITGEFAKWANGPRGQNQLTTFFRRAGQSASELGGFLKAVTVLLATILTQGRETGDSLFGEMTRAITGWTDKLKANPDILGDWFRSAHKFGQAIGDLVVGVGKLFDSLDTGLSRGEITGAFKGLGSILTVVAHALEGIGHILGPVVDAFSRLPPHIQTIAIEAGIAAVAFRRLQGGLLLARDSMTTFGGGVRNAETRMATLSATARNIAGPAGLVVMAGAATATSRKMKVLGDAAAGALLGFSVGGPIGAAIGGFAGALIGLDAQIDHVKSSLLSSRTAIRLYKQSLDPLTGAITAKTRRTIFDQIKHDSPFAITQSRKLGVATRDLVSASLGNASAQERVKAAFKGQPAMLDLVMSALNSAGGDYRKAAKQALDSANATNTWSEALRGVPKRVVTRLKADGFRESRADLLKIINTMHLTPRSIRILLRAFGIDQTVADFRRSVKAAQEAGKQKPHPKISLDHAQYDAAVKAALKAAFNLDHQRPTPKSDLKDGTSKPAKQVINLLDILGNKHPSPRVTAEVAAANAAINSVRNNLASLKGKKIAVEVTHIATNIVNTITHTKKGARGGILEGMRGVGVDITAGEAGPEALVPLNRPLSQVDPSVRILSAIAQGLTPPKMASGGVVGGRSINVSPGAIQVITPNSDPRAVALTTLNELVARFA